MGTREWRQRTSIAPQCEGTLVLCGGCRGLVPVLVPALTQLESEGSTLPVAENWFPFQSAGDCVQGKSETREKKGKNYAANVNCSALLGHQTWTSQTTEGQEVSGKQKVCECFLSSLTERKKKSEIFLLEKHIWLYNILNFKSCNFFLFVWWESELILLIGFVGKVFFWHFKGY